MKSKNEVYVAVSSKKVAKKLKKVFDMFGEKVYSDNSIDQALRKGFIMEFYMDDWCNNSYNSHDKTKVTVKQLKQILFREHAKEGDVVIVDNGKFGSRWVLELTGNDVASFEHSNSFDLKTGENDFCKFGNSIAGGNFIRYATEEEKALLNPKKELEVGKWYWGNREKLIFVSELSECGDLARGYGIGANGNWYDDDGSFSWTTADLKEATKEEVEQALIKESEKRGFVKGAVFQGVEGYEKDMRIPIEEVRCSYGEYCGLYSGNSWLYLNGKWGEKIEESPKINALDVAVVDRLSDIVEKHYSIFINKPPIINDARQLAEKLRKLL